MLLITVTIILLCTIVRAENELEGNENNKDDKLMKLGNGGYQYITSFSSTKGGETAVAGSDSQHGKAGSHLLGSVFSSKQGGQSERVSHQSLGSEKSSDGGGATGGEYGQQFYGGSPEWKKLGGWSSVSSRRYNGDQKGMIIGGGSRKSGEGGMTQTGQGHGGLGEVGGGGFRLVKVMKFGGGKGMRIGGGEGRRSGGGESMTFEEGEEERIGGGQDMRSGGSDSEGMRFRGSGGIRSGGGGGIRSGGGEGMNFRGGEGMRFGGSEGMRVGGGGGTWQRSNFAGGRIQNGGESKFASFSGGNVGGGRGIGQDEHIGHMLFQNGGRLDSGDGKRELHSGTNTERNSAGNSGIGADGHGNKNGGFRGMGFTQIIGGGFRGDTGSKSKAGGLFENASGMRSKILGGGGGIGGGQFSGGGLKKSFIVLSGGKDEENGNGSGVESNYAIGELGKNDKSGGSSGIGINQLGGKITGLKAMGFIQSLGGGFGGDSGSKSNAGELFENASGMRSKLLGGGGGGGGGIASGQFSESGLKKSFRNLSGGNGEGSGNGGGGDSYAAGRELGRNDKSDGGRGTGSYQLGGKNSELIAMEFAQSLDESLRGGSGSKSNAGGLFENASGIRSKLLGGGGGGGGGISVGQFSEGELKKSFSILSGGNGEESEKLGRGSGGATISGINKLGTNSGMQGGIIKRLINKKISGESGANGNGGNKGFSNFMSSTGGFQAANGGGGQKSGLLTGALGKEGSENSEQGEIGKIIMISKLKNNLSQSSSMGNLGDGGFGGGELLTKKISYSSNPQAIKGSESSMIKTTRCSTDKGETITEKKV